MSLLPGDGWERRGAVVLAVDERSRTRDKMAPAPSRLLARSRSVGIGRWGRMVEGMLRISGQGFLALPGPSRQLIVGSAPNGRTKIAQRQLRGCFASTLGTVVDMAPASQQASSFGVQEHHERLGQRIDLDPVAGPPLGRGRAGGGRRTLHQTPEPRMLHVDDPRAVAGLDDDLFHGHQYPMNRPGPNFGLMSVG